MTAERPNVTCTPDRTSGRRGRIFALRGGLADRGGRERRGAGRSGREQGDGGDGKEKRRDLAQDLPHISVLRASLMKYLRTLHVNAPFTQAPSRAPTNGDDCRRSPARPP